MTKEGSAISGIDPVTMESPWLTVPDPNPWAPVRLLCLPYAGGGASAFLGWPKALPTAEIVAIRLPGRETRIRESPVFDIDELTAAVLPLTDQPYAIFGHSMGAWVGFELCRRLSRLGASLPNRLFVSGSAAPHLGRRNRRFEELSDTELAERLLELGGTPPAIVGEPELWQLVAPILRADLAWSDNYVYADEARLACPISSFAGDGDPLVSLEEAFAWREHTTSDFTLRTVSGDHFFLHSRQHELLTAIAADVAVRRSGS